MIAEPMAFRSRARFLILLVGDLLVLTLALWLTLALRYLAWPSTELFLGHLSGFGWLFLPSILSFFIYDLYRPRTLIFNPSLAPLVLQAQLLNSIIAVLAFYFIPYFNQIGVTPKKNLFIYLVVSSVLLLAWRQLLARALYRPRRTVIRFQCRGAEVEELRLALEQTERYRLAAVGERPQLIIVNRYEAQSEEELAEFYQLLFQGVQFVGVQELYEEVFGRVPLGLVNERWFLEQISNRPTLLYDALKRGMDLFLGLGVGMLSLVVYPFIILAIKLNDGGPIFFIDERVGRHGRPIWIAKFRSMVPRPELHEARITRVGRFLRRTRLDELPQIWSVVRGEQSLIGPRPERREYVELYRTRIPFYDARHSIAPGLSGWAQMYHEDHPHFTVAEDQTREKLSYDLYYIKHRSLWLDIAIALKTIKVLLRRQGI